MKKLFKIGTQIILGLLALVILILWLLHMGVFNSVLLKAGTVITEKYLNVELKIEKLEGSVFKGIHFYNVEVFQSQTKILSLSEFSIQYQLTELLNNKISINEIRCIQPEIVIYQMADSSWNFEHLIIRRNKKDTTPGKNNWEIDIKSNLIEKLKITNQSTDTTLSLPARVGLNLQHSFKLNPAGIFLGIDTLSLSTKKPDFLIRNFTGNVFYGNDTLKWDNVNAHLDSTRLKTAGNLFLGKQLVVDAQLYSKELVMSDFKAFVKSVSLQGTPEFKVSVQGNSQHMKGDLLILDNQQKIELKAVLNNLNHLPEYNFEIKVDSFNGFYWTEDERFRSNLSGKVTGAGSGFDYTNNSFKIWGLLKNISYNNYSAKVLDINATKEHEKLWGEIYSQTWFGKLKANFNLNNIFSVPDYKFALDYQQVNLEKLLGDSALISNLNGKLYLKGKGISPENLQLQAKLTSGQSELLGYEIQAADADVEYLRGFYKINNLEVRSPLILVTAKGSGDLKASNNLIFYMEPRKTDTILQLLGWPVISAKGYLSGTMEGSLKNFNINAGFNLSDIAYDSLFVNKATGEADFVVIPNKMKGTFAVLASQLDYKSYHVNQLKLNGDYLPDSMYFNADVAISDSFKIELNSALQTKNSPIISLHHLLVNYQDQKWEAGSDSTKISLMEKNIEVNHFKITNTDQSIWVNGILSFSGEEDIELKLSNIVLQQLPLSNYIDFLTSGELSAQVTVIGNSKDPIVNINTDWNNPGVNGIRFNHLKTTAGYKNGRLKMNGELYAEISRQIAFEADVPLHLSLSDSIWLNKNDTSLNFKASVDSLSLETIDRLMPESGMNFSGLLKAEIKIDNSLNNPVLGGFATIPKANFDYKEYGIDYKNIVMNVNLEQNTVKLSRLYAESGKGNITISGKMQINDQFSGLTSDYTLSVFGKDFEAMKTYYAHATISPNFTLKGQTSNSITNGRVKVTSGYLNADYFTELFSAAAESVNPPLLVEAAKKQDTLFYSDSIKTAKPGVDLQTNLKKLNGEINVFIPGNTWLEGKDINVELKGDIRLIFTNGKFDIFGDVSVKRGYYKLYGRRFAFSKGELVFTGSEEINPQLDFILLYKFRDINRELRELTILVNGTPKLPEFQFKLDQQVIEEKDAISYLLFGKSTQQLSENEQSSLANSSTLAKNLALNQLTSFLKGKIQETVGLDVVEIEGDSDWKRSSVTVGKYLTNNLYLEYEQGITMGDSENILDTEKVMLEYQLIRSLFLKATNQSNNSGFDIIFKKSW